jgi:protein phosphatase
VFGGKLTALRYPEKELVSVPAAHTYYEPIRPFLEGKAAPGLEPEREPDLLDIEDVLGKRIIETPLVRSITIREENAAAALEVMSRFAADPRWLIYLPPTMAPPATSARPDLLEHPAEAFAAYRHEGVPTVVCQDKHMGSRAVVIVCRDDSVAARRFGMSTEAGGICYTRTGRPFFSDAGVEAALLERVRSALDRTRLWEELKTDWLALDCELLPWSAKAEELLREQYAAVGAAATAALPAAVSALQAAVSRGIGVGDTLERFQERASMAESFVEAYGRYCWSVEGIGGLRLAPFQVLAGDGSVHLRRDHRWHTETAARLSENGEGLLIPTPYRVADLTDPESQAEAERWWEESTAAGSEGMVVKPLESIARGRRGLVQPGIKVRGREYLRIIYGPEYTAPEHLERLRERALGRKRALATREFALGLEALERFVRGEPLYRVHECVFGILALESEPVDPRL